MQLLSIFLAKQVHFHLASRLSKFRVKTRNRKVSKELENGQPEGRRDRIRLASGNRNLENGRETRNRPGLGQRVHSAHRFRFGAGSQGINSQILLPLTTLVHFPLRVSRARWCVLSLVAFRLEIAFRELVILLVSVIRLVRDGSKAERRARLPEERDASHSG